MGQFDIHKWRQKQLFESYKNRLSNQILDQLFEGLIPQNTLLNESKFLKGLKDKIKNTKAFASLVGLASDFKNSSKAITFALRLNALGILPKNEAELQALKDKLEGKKIKVNEQNEAYSNKLDSELPEGDEDTKEMKRDLVHSIIDVGSGFLIAILIQMYIFPMFGLYPEYLIN